MEFQHRDRVVACLLVVLNISHVKEVPACDQAGGYAVEYWIAAFQNLEFFDGPKVVTQNKADYPRRHEGILNSYQCPAMKIETVDSRETQVVGTRN